MLYKPEYTMLSVWSNDAIKWPPDCAKLNMSCAFLALLQCQRSRQGQNGCPAEVKERQGRDEARDWPTSVVCIYCPYVFVSYHNIKTINVISSTLQTTCCLLLLFNPIHCILHIYTVHKLKPGSISDNSLGCSETTKKLTWNMRVSTWWGVYQLRYH